MSTLVHISTVAADRLFTLITVIICAALLFFGAMSFTRAHAAAPAGVVEIGTSLTYVTTSSGGVLSEQG